MSMRNWKMPALVSTMILALVAVRAPAQGPADQGKPAAVVDGTPISMTELEAVLKQAPPSPTPLTDSQKKHMRDEALMMMVDDILLQQFLRNNGPQVDPNEVPKKIAELEVGLKKQNKILQDFLKETGQSEAQLRMSVLSMLQWEAFVKQHLTDDDVKKYYLESKDFFDRTAVRASHIVIRIPSTASSTEREAAKAKLAALKQEIEAGRIDFAEAAKKQSQCTSAPNGGDIGYFPR